MKRNQEISTVIFAKVTKYKKPTYFIISANDFIFIQINCINCDNCMYKYPFCL